MRDGPQEVYVVAVGGGEPRRLTFDGGGDYLPSFTQDGRSVRFMRVRPGGYDFLQVPLDGSRPPRPWWTGTPARRAAQPARATAMRSNAGMRLA
jgi:tricorn protease